MNLQPLPLEKELRLESVKRQVSEFSREELEEHLVSALDILTRMTHQTKQLLTWIDALESRVSPYDDLPDRSV